MHIVRVIRSAEHLSRLVTTAGLAWLLASALGLSVAPIATVLAAGTSTPARPSPRPSRHDRHPDLRRHRDRCRRQRPGRLHRGSRQARGRRRRAGAGHPAQHTGRQSRCDPAHRLVAPQIARAGRRVGRPSGGRAASAGTFITLAANLAYMAPGTNIGAASPVGEGGAELTGTIGEKVKNDAIANIKSIAQHRGRNVDWAVSTVDKAISSPASEAVNDRRGRWHRHLAR